MDTNTSPKSSSPKISGILSAVLSVGAVVWATAAITGTASAQTTARPVVSEAVSYSDLDLSTQHGASALLKRIDQAAARICGPAPSNSPLQRQAAAFHERCIRKAVDLAVARTSAPLVLALHTGAGLPSGDAFAAR